MAEVKRMVRPRVAGVVVVLLAVSSAYAVGTMFSCFAPWDDQGFFMMTVQHQLHGVHLYQDDPVIYGPFYYLERWILHGVLGIPLTHDAVRVVATLHWIATALASAGLAAAVTSSRGVPLAAFATTFVWSMLRLDAIAVEPGHPQELGALIVGLSLLGVALLSRRRPWLRAGTLGAATAALALTKINLGALYGLAALAAFSIDLPRTRVARVARGAVLVVVMAFPLVVVRDGLTVW